MANGHRLVVHRELLLLEAAVVAVAVEDTGLIGQAATEEPAVDHHAPVARRRNGGRHQRAKGEVEIGRADELFAAEWHLESPTGHFQLAVALPVHEDIAPLAVGIQVAFDLKVDVLPDLAIDAAAAHAKVVGVLVDRRIERPPVELELEPEIDAHVPKLKRRTIPPVHARLGAFVVGFSLRGGRKWDQHRTTERKDDEPNRTRHRLNIVASGPEMNVRVAEA